MRIKFWIYIICCLLPGIAIAASSRLTTIQVSDTRSSARLEFSLSQLTQYRVFTLEHPARLVVDFNNTRLDVNLNTVSLPSAIMQTVRAGHPTPSTLRLVFDLRKPVQFQTLTQRQKILLDVRTEKNSAPSFEKPAVEKTPIIKEARRREIVVVIDPGHGGKDPGAIGEYGSKEKNVVLAISQRLADLIDRQPNMRAVLTRKGDYFVPLRERLKLARKGKADLFVAIHADSYFNAHSSGASVYALSRRGATSEAARWIARRDNYSELGGVDLGELEDKSYVLRSVLIDLAQTATITDSLRLGTSMLDSLDNVTRLHYSRVEQAPFVVLKSPDIPSVLVETGFISNPNEERKLRDESYQNKIAQALFNGIQMYLRKYSL